MLNIHTHDVLDDLQHITVTFLQLAKSLFFQTDVFLFPHSILDFLLELASGVLDLVLEQLLHSLLLVLLLVNFVQLMVDLVVDFLRVGL